MGTTRGYPGVRTEFAAGSTVAYDIAGCSVVLTVGSTGTCCTGGCTFAVAAESTTAYGIVGCAVVLAIGSTGVCCTGGCTLMFAAEPTIAYSPGGEEPSCSRRRREDSLKGNVGSSTGRQQRSQLS